MSAVEPVEEAGGEAAGVSAVEPPVEEAEEEAREEDPELKVEPPPHDPTWTDSQIPVDDEEEEPVDGDELVDPGPDEAGSDPTTSTATGGSAGSAKIESPPLE